jgi:hypothetical protein
LAIGPVSVEQRPELTAILRNLQAAIEHFTEAERIYNDSKNYSYRFNSASTSLSRRSLSGVERNICNQHLGNRYYTKLNLTNAANHVQRRIDIIRQGLS